MKTKTILIYADPGHAWARVDRKELAELGVLNSITTYSYQRGDFVYLEEDCDLSTYIQALKAKHGGAIDIRFRERVARERQSKIRGYHRFQPQ